MECYDTHLAGKKVLLLYITFSLVHLFTLYTIIEYTRYSLEIRVEKDVVDKNVKIRGHWIMHLYNHGSSRVRIWPPHVPIHSIFRRRWKVEELFESMNSRREVKFTSPAWKLTSPAWNWYSFFGRETWIIWYYLREKTF